MSESFYGGRKGTSFIISKTYHSIEEMIEDFGNSNCTVNYDEYVFIDSLAYKSEDNGKIYKRGYPDTTDNGAIYIGLISGPAGQPSLMLLSTIDEVEEKGGVNAISGDYNLLNSLVPGKYTVGEEIKYNDSIKWKQYSLIDVGNNVSTAYIGFEIPYTVFELEATLVNSISEGELIVEKISNDEHPFYEKWRIKIPNGLGGSSSAAITEIKVIVPTETNVENYINKQSDITNRNLILVYTYESKNYYIGPYSMISTLEDGITVSQDGTLTIKYTYGNNQDKTKVYNKLFKWIKELLITDKGIFKIVFNTGEVYEKDLHLLKDITFNSGNIEGEGDLKLYSNFLNGETQSISPAINYILSTKITQDYHLIFRYSDPERRKKVVNEGKAYPQAIDGYSDWEDMGSIKDDSGILIKFNFNPDNYVGLLDTNELIITFLNIQFPTGLEGKIVSVGRETESKALYAFDYNTTETGDYVGWYYLGSIGGNLIISNIIVANSEDEEALNKFNSMPAGSVWFVLEG